MSETFDLLIRNASIIDGTGEPRYDGDIGIHGDRIARIGDLADARGTREIDLPGRVAAPGFIDVAYPRRPAAAVGLADDAEDQPGRHHRDRRQLRRLARAHAAADDRPGDAAAEPARRQRRLVQVSRASPTTWTRCAPSRPPPTAPCWWATSRCACRPWTTCRAQPAPTRSRRCARWSRRRWQAGAIGVSTGLFYEPACAASAEEVIAVCRPLAAHGGDLLHAHAQRGGAGRRCARGDLPHRPRARRAGGDLAPQGQACRELRPLARDAGADREAHGASSRSAWTAIPTPPVRPILLTSRLAGANRVIVSWSKPLPQYAGSELDDIARELGHSREEAVARLQPGRRHLLHDGRGRRAAHHEVRPDDDRLGRPAARRLSRTRGCGAPSRACSATTAARSACSRWRRRCTR